MNTLKRRLDPKSDAGLSLVELLVAMLITSIVMVMVSAMFINVARITSTSNATTQRSSIGANVMDQVSKVIRTATNNAVATSIEPEPAIVAGTATTLTLYTFVDAAPALPAPTKVGYRFENGYLVEDRWTASDSNGYWVFSGTASSRTIGGPLDTANGALFTYLDSTGTVITPGGTGLSLAQRQSVASIRVTVRIINPTVTNDPIVIINTVGMPNLKTSGAGN